MSTVRERVRVLSQHQQEALTPELILRSKSVGESLERAALTIANLTLASRRQPPAAVHKKKKPIDQKAAIEQTTQE